MSARQHAYDVVVIGGGVAGVIAAKKVADHQKSVCVVKGGGGASVHASGAFDVVGGPGTMRESIKALLARNPHHPYALVGAGDPAAVEGLLDEAAKDLFRDLDEEGLLYRGSLTKSLWLATPAGHVKESAYAQDAIAAGDLGALAKGRLAVVAVGEAAEGRAAARAAALRAALDARGFFGLKDVVPCPIDALPEGAGRQPDEVNIARALDEPAACAGWAKEVAKVVAAKAPRSTHVLFPPVLGLADPAVAVATLARALGREIAEAVATPPSVPGLRLERALLAILARKKIALVRGEAREARASGGQVKALVVTGPEGTTTVEGKVFILAGGRFLGGGLRDGALVVEPLFDLPIFHRGRPIAELAPLDRFERRVSGDHAALQFGVRCDADLRPIGRAGGPAFENLFAAGSILDSAGFASARAGLGVALATGFVAGLNAAEAA
jgi:glycerol-3-phosphate dehydrogenase subunit B